ncbi:MAG: hypothetical protein GY700_13495 [Propionibacteriaceae bacterium]|nr:hypothetical protein [Propionibacteriaceae bacterium]
MPFDPMRQPADEIYISDRLVPGISEIKGLDAKRDWEERKSFGMMGARLRLKGMKLSHFSVIVRLYTQEHWEDWLEFGPIVRRPPQPDASQITAITSIPSLHRFMRDQSPPLSIRHPLLEEYRITQVVVENNVAPVEDEKGVWTIDIKLIQYQEPQRVLSSSGGRDREAGTSRQDREIAALTSQLNQLAGSGNR